MQADFKSKWAFFENAAHFALAVALALFSLSPNAIAQKATASQTLSGHVPKAIARLHLQPLSNLPETNQLRLAISLPLRNEQALNALLQQIYDPNSPNYHHYLTSDQFTAQFGPSQQDYDAVIQFFQSNGLTIAQTHSDRTLVDVTGSVLAIQNVFHTTLRIYKHPVENRTFFAPDTDPIINLSVPIKHVDGLDNFVIPHPLIRKSPSSSRSGAKPAIASGSGPNGEYMGHDFRAAYVPGVALNGAGQTVALFELDGYHTNDIAFYEQTNSLPQQTLVNVAVDGGVPNPGSGEGEVALDIEMVVSMATNLSEVLVYEAPNGGLTSVPDLLSRIATDNIAKQISSSWLIGDSPTYDTYYQEMAAKGQSFFQASGDDDAYYNGIQEWADDTNITLVGGTTLSTTGPAGAWFSETVWNWYPGQAAGSGGGVNFNGVPIPPYQVNVGMTNNMGSTTLRNVPDVALTADNIYIVYGNGQTEDVGGTSCASPLWAAFTALVNQQALAEGLSTVGFLNPAIYSIGLSPNYQNCFHDITTGNNTNTTVGPNIYFATNGYDLCTGWGTPNGQNLINALAPSPNPLTIAPGTGFTATGPDGGPFVPGSQTYGLTNTGASSLSWSLSNTSSWLVASITHGTLASGTGTNVTFSVASNASGLTSGTYATTVVFTNVGSGLVLNLQFTLQVTDPLIVAPSSGFSASAAVEGGPFTPVSGTFALTNIGTVALNWQATGPVWLNLSPTNGTLAGGASTTMKATVNSSASHLTTGTYNGQVAFTDEGDGFVQNLPFTLVVGGQNIVLNGGFETGDFTDWVNAGGSANFVDNSSQTGIPPHSGAYLAALSQSGSVGYISQTLPTFANQSYLLSLWFYSPYLGRHVANTPNQFVVLWNGTTQYNYVNIPAFAKWTNVQFVVTATAPQTVLQIGGRDDPSYLGLDDVSVLPIPSPNIQGISRVPGNRFSLTWFSQTNIQYRVQYTTNLASPTWLNVNTYTATGPLLSVTNSITNKAAFYRVLQLP